MWNIFVVSYALTAALGDVMWRKIPKQYTTAGMIIGIVFNTIHSGWFGFGSSLAACVIAFAAGVVLFQLGAMGGGDVKLLVAIGAMLGFSRWLFAVEVAILFAGAMALVQAIRTGRLRQTLANMVDLMRWIFSKGIREHPVVKVSNAAMLRAPFGVAAAVGTVWAVIRP